MPYCLHHLIETWDKDDFAKIGDFQMRTLRLVVFLHKTFPRCARGLCHLMILTKMTISIRATNACLQKIVHGGDFNNNAIFSFAKLFVHG